MFQPASTDDLLRFDLILSEDADPKNRVVTFTWGRTYSEAYARVVDTMDSEDGLWDGWSFQLSQTHRKV